MITQVIPALSVMRYRIEDRQATLGAFMAETFPEPVLAPSSNNAARTPHLTDAHVLDAARAATNGAAISALLAGDIAGYQSPSEAVAGLLYHLAWWTQKDAAQMRRIFEGSGLRDLWAEKWDRLGDSEISKAIAGVTETYSPPVPVCKRDAGVASSAAGPPVAAQRQETASAAPGALGAAELEPVVSKMYKSAAELLERKIPDARWAIEPILPEGLAIFAGKPKIGKSWICLDWCIAVASGTTALGAYPTEPGEVLYLALEDHDRRMQARLRQVLKGGKLPADFTYVTDAYPRLDNGGLESLRAWLTTAKHPRLIIIDTLKRIRAPHTANGNPYDQDSDALKGLKTLADEFHVCIVVVHHLRKAPAEEDVFDEISGTLGLTGTADTNIIIKRSRGQTDATLHVTGRDIKIESATALRWDALAGRWSAMGDAENFKGSEKRREIVEILEGSATGPMTPKQIADALGHPNTTNVRRLLFKMHADKQVFRIGESLYSVPDAPAVTLC